MMVKGIQIGVAHDPFFVSESEANSFLQAGDCFFCFSKQGVRASDVVKHRAVFGFHIECPLGPFEAPFPLTDFAKRGGAEVNSAHVVGMELEVPFDPLQCFLLCGTAFLGISQASPTHS